MLSSDNRQQSSVEISSLIKRAIDNFVNDYKAGAPGETLRVGEYVLYSARGALYGPSNDLAAVHAKLGKLINRGELRGDDFIVISIPENLPSDRYELAGICVAKKNNWGLLPY